MVSVDLFQEEGKITFPGVLMLGTIFFSDLSIQTWLKKWYFIILNSVEKTREFSVSPGRRRHLSPSPGCCQGSLGRKAGGRWSGFPIAPIPFPRSVAWCVMRVWEAAAGEDMCSDEGISEVDRDSNDLWEALVGQGSRSDGHHGESCGGTRDKGHRGRKGSETFPLGGLREVGRSACRCWRWLRPGVFRPGKGKDAQFLPFCQEMPDAAAGLGRWAQLCRFPGPHGPWGILLRGRDGVSGHTWPHPELLPPWPSVCAHMWARQGRCDVDDHLCGWHLRNGTEEKGHYC